MEITQKINGKINFNLYVKGIDERGYHEIESYVGRIAVFDEITVSLRNDDKITLTMQGVKVDCPVEDNNAYKTAVLFKEKFALGGFDIKITKNIAVGGGLGGSSADICGVAKCLMQLYGLKEDDVLGVLKTLGSDTVYMYGNGYGEISGNGNEVRFLKSDMKMYLILALPNFSVTAKEAYELYDKYQPKNKNAEYFYNALYFGVSEKYPQLKEIRTVLEGTQNTGVSMTGSGSVMFAVYENREIRDREFEKLKKEGVEFIKTETV